MKTISFYIRFGPFYERVACEGDHVNIIRYWDRSKSKFIHDENRVMVDCYTIPKKEFIRDWNDLGEKLGWEILAKKEFLEIIHELGRSKEVFILN